MGSFSQKLKRYDLKNLQSSYASMDINAKFEEELTFHFKTNMRNLTNFDTITRKSEKFGL